MEAALELIAEVGFEGTTIELISSRSGVSRSTIYRHWPDPSVLYLEAFDPPTPALAPPEPTGDTEADLRAYVAHVVDRLNDERFAAALAAQIDKGSRDPAYRDAHLSYAVARNEHGVNVFRAGVREGVLREDLDPEHETDLILGFLTYKRIVQHRILDEAVVAVLLDGVFDRCRARPATSATGQGRRLPGSVPSTAGRLRDLGDAQA